VPILQEFTTMRTRAVVLGMNALAYGTISIPPPLNLKLARQEADEPLWNENAVCGCGLFAAFRVKFKRSSGGGEWARVARMRRVAARRVRVGHHPILASQGTCLPQL